MSRGITQWSQSVADALSQFQDAFFFTVASILFLVSQIMSAPCTLWFFTQLAGTSIAAGFFAVVIELSGGYASWELMRRIDENNLPNVARKRKLPTWLCWLTAGVSIALEGTAIYAYIYAHATPLAIANRLGIVDVVLYAVLASVLALVGAMIVGFHAQRVRLNIRELQDTKPQTDGSAKNTQSVQQELQPMQETTKDFACPNEWCNRGFNNRHALAAHIRWCKKP